EWGRQRFGIDVPAERRLADLESSLAQVKLDPRENASLLALLPRHSAAEGPHSGVGIRGVAPAAIGGGDQLGDRWGTGAADGAGARRSALGRSNYARRAARHGRTRCVGAALRRDDDPAGIPSVMGHALASRYHPAGTA